MLHISWPLASDAAGSPTIGARRLLTGTRGMKPPPLLKGTERMSTEERLEKLERELFAEKRRARWLLATVGLGVLGVLAWTWATSTPTAQAQGANTGPKVIRATQFILEDETGKARARLVVDKDGPGLALYDETGQIRAGLGVNKDGAELTLLDETSKPRAMLSMGKDGPGLVLGDETGKKRVGLAVDKEGPRLALDDETGKARAGLTVSKDGPRLALSDETGKVIWSQP